PAAVKSTVHLDQHVKRAARFAHRIGPAARDVGVVDDDRDGGTIHERAETGGIRRLNRVRQTDVGNPGADEHLRLADLRAADAGRAAFDLPPGHDRRLVSLRVGAEAYARLGGERLGAINVRAKCRTVDEDLRRGEI